MNFSDYEVVEEKDDYVKIKHKHTGECHIIDDRRLMDVFLDVPDDFVDGGPTKSGGKLFGGLKRKTKSFFSDW